MCSILHPIRNVAASQQPSSPVLVRFQQVVLRSCTVSHVVICMYIHGTVGRSRGRRSIVMFPSLPSEEANRARMNRDGHSSHTAPSSPVQHSYGWPRLTDTAYGAALVLVPVLLCCCWFASMCSVWLDRPPINAALEFHRHSSGRLLVAGESGGRITAPFD